MTSAEVSVEATDGETTILKSVCRSCHGGCGTLLHVRGGELIKVEGDPDSPLNRGRLCPIGTVTRDLVYHPDRLKYPMRRVGKRGSGQWDRITWDEALDEIATRLGRIKEEYGPESIALGTGTGRHHIRWVSRFGHALGTPNWAEPGFAQCFHPRVNTCILTMGEYPVCDFTGDVPAETIMYWGHNPVNSGPDGETRFNARDSLAQAKNIIVVDPRETELAKRADIWLQVRPGADDALGLAMLNVIIGEKLYDEDFVSRWTHGFDALAAHVGQYSPEWAEPITWVAAGKIRAAARLFAKTKPALLEWGCAIEHTPKCIQTIRALSMLPVLTGNIEIPGGWVFGMKGIGRFPSLIELLSPEANAKRLGGQQFKLLGGEGADLPAAHIPTLLQAMREGKPYPVKAFLVFGNNTLTTYANSSLVYESLMKLDFMVNADLFMTPTAELADIVLPAASWPELDQIAGLPTIAANVVLGQQKSVRVHECKADEEIFTELARRMNLPGCTEPVRDVLDSQLKGLGITFEELTKKGFVKVPFKYGKHEEKGFKTPTGKIELYSTRLEQMGYAPLPYYEEPPESPISAPETAKDFPLVLTTGGRIPFYFNSEHRQLPKLRKARRDPQAEIHPDTAARFGIESGDWMWIETKRGRMKQKAKLTTGIDARVINAEHAWWFPDEEGPEYGVWKSNVNLLTNSEPPYDPAMGTYQLRALLCRIGKAE
ncbi:molybdopterin oxidoreductase [Paramagnetospirillum caucaseum]|uniref:Molybdopterin oxidoreductase n=1 Tax=Paramagnetospirillum caucaseum TaxID=1244869 RepID=M2Z9B4_9PROT|nr:molybdopterin-dependent oxidoreductase [Paramagnetospirillum caucaseum]EME70965.1 molybdopterin oxidoreductase [Paramagnetospirillum caucaseum]